jgi:hypothetical protein
MSQDPYPSERPTAGSQESPYDGGAHDGSTYDGEVGQGGSQPYQPAQPYQQPYQQAYQQPYPSGGYQAGPYQSYQPSYAALEGEKAAQLSLILGLVGLFVAGFVLGPLAIWQATKAERLGVPATAGKILGWIVTVLYALAILATIVVVIIVVAGLGATATYSS